MSIKRTASPSGGSPGGGGFWTGLAAWSGLAVSLANLALLMHLWDRLPVADLKESLDSVLHRDTHGLTQDGRAADGARALEPAREPAARTQPAAPPPPVEPAPALAGDTSRVAAPGRADAGTRPPQPAPEQDRPGIRLQVQNGSGVRLLAARAAEELRRLHYDVRETGTSKEALDRTRIVSRVQDPAPSLRLAQDLGLSSARISYEEDPGLVDIDVTLILGADYQKLPILGQR